MRLLLPEREHTFTAAPGPGMSSPLLKCNLIYLRGFCDDWDLF